MRKCCVCKIEKPLSGFNRNKTKKDGYHTLCKQCSRAASKKHYLENKKKYIQRKKQAIAENRKLVYNYYLTHPCIDCGEADPIVLEFDHVKDKVIAISKAVNSGWSKERILAEIEKCEIRCANCHRRKTAKQLGWYKYI